MSTDTYNGWANRATWLVVLHLNNEHALQAEALETAADAYTDAVANVPAFMEDDSPERVDRYAVSITADYLKSWVEDFACGLPYETGPTTPGELLACDLVGTALASVDWVEVAEAFLEDAERVTDAEQVDA